MKLKIPDLLRITNPRWVKKLETRKTWREIDRACIVDGEKLNIGKYSCCFVGETLNLFKKNYNDYTILEFHNGCQKCADFSSSFNSIIENLLYGYRYTKHNLEDELKDFAQHIKHEHYNYIVNARSRARRKSE